jgi:hypothetical protein
MSLLTPPITPALSEIDLDEPDDEEGEMVSPGELVDIDIPKKDPKKGGRPTKSLLDDLTQKCYRKSKPSKHIWRCVGVDCGFIQASRSMRRVTRHAKSCSKLPGNLRTLAAEEAAKNAPSRRLEELEEKGEDVAGKKQKPEREVIPKGNSEGKAYSLVENARRTGRKEKQRQLDLAIVKLFCVAGLPTHLADRPEWKDVLSLADSSYRPACEKHWSMNTSPVSRNM